MTVKDLRDETGLSQQELADATGIPKDRIGKWEQGKGKPKVEDQKKLDAFYSKYKKEKVPQSLNGGAGVQMVREDMAEYNSDSRKRLEITLQNLSEDKIRSTAIIERLVALLEQQFNYGTSAKAAEVQSGSNSPVADPFADFQLGKDVPKETKDNVGSKGR